MVVLQQYDRFLRYAQRQAIVLWIVENGLEIGSLFSRVGCLFSFSNQLSEDIVLAFVI